MPERLARQLLHRYSSSLLRGLKKINYRNSQACRDCAIRSQCTGNQFRSASRLENEAVLDRMQARIAQRPKTSSTNAARSSSHAEKLDRIEETCHIV
jgi:hypothetical protein